MATHASHVSFLLLGVVLLTNYFALAKAESTEEGDKIKYLQLNSEEKDDDNDNTDHALETRGLFDGFVSNVRGTITSSGDSINNFGNSDNNEYHSGGIINSGITFTSSSDNAIEITTDGLILRGLKTGKRVISITDNQIFFGDKLVCEDINTLYEEPIYQKSADGALWYTNAKIGEPMNKTEIDKFEADWVLHIQEQEKRAAERERQHKERMDALKQRLKKEAEERERQQKERKDALKARLKRQAEQRARQQKERKDALNARLKKRTDERERQQKERKDALNARLQKQAEARERQKKERADALNARLK